MTGTEAKDTMGGMGSCPRLRPADLSPRGIRRAEERQDRADTVVRRIARGEAQFGEDAGDVSLDGPCAQEELLGYPKVGPPLRHVPQPLDLALVQRVHHAQLPVSPEQPPHDRRVDDGLPRRHPLQALHERARVGPVVLQQVADPGAHRFKQLARVARFRVGRQDQDAGIWVQAAYLVRGADALVTERRRHADVEDDGLGRAVLDRREQFRAGGDARGNLGAERAQEQGQAAAEQPGVFRDRYPHGIVTTRRVPRPGGLSMTTSPSSAPTRSAMLASPWPLCAVTPPVPSSAISISSRESPARTATSALSALACFTTFASASQATKYSVASMAASSLRDGTSTLTGSGRRSATSSSAAPRPYWDKTAG